MSLAIENRRPLADDALALSLAGLFVVLWSTGFIGGKFGLPYAGPFTFLTLRFALALAMLVPLLLIWQTPWPQSWRDVGHMAVAGLLLNIGCLGGCFYAMSLGLPSAVVAVIGGLQPLLTAMFAGVFLGERVRVRQWLGLGLGFVGIVMLLSDKISLGSAPPVAIVAAFAGLTGITATTLYQKRFCTGIPVRSGAAIQLAAALVVTLPLGLAMDGLAVHWTDEFVLALLWLAGLSIGVMILLWVLVRRGAASKVSSLFYLTPPTTALMGWAFFGERFGTLALLGMAIVVIGVALATREQPAAKTAS